VSYPEQSQAIREALARVLEAEEEWTKAAQVLQGIDLDSGGRVDHGRPGEGERGRDVGSLVRFDKLWDAWGRGRGGER
jgi:Arc/MetJ-type ribon-helix-helix transcriptional regulator